MPTLPRTATTSLALLISVGALAIPTVALAATDPVSNPTTTGVVATSASTTLSGLSVTDSTPSAGSLQVTLSTDLGTLTLPTTTGLTVSAGDSFTTDASISFNGTVANVNAALAAAKLNTAAATGTAHVSLSSMATTAGTAYNPANGHFYQVVAGNTSWTSANTAAGQKTFHGLTGYLATPATAQVNTFLTSTFTTSQLWIGGQSTDSTGGVLVDGVLSNRSWRWVTGPYNGTIFTRCLEVIGGCTHPSGDSAYYYNWDTGQPDDSGLGLLNNENYASTNYAGHAGKWNDNSNNPGGIGGYIVEYGNATTSTTYPTSPPSVATASVTVANKPAVPTGVTITAGNQTATAAYTAPANPVGAPVTGFTVTATPHAGGTAITSTCGASTTTCTVSGLTNGTNYDVTVRANNAAGNGVESAVTNLTPAGAPGVPSAVTATAGDGQASIAFTAPTANNGATIASYTVTATPSGGGAAVTRTCSGSPCAVTGLTNGTAYSVTVHATSTLGVSGAESTPVTVTPAGRPSSGPTGFTAAAGDGQATLTFTPVVAQPSVSGYTATITPQGGSALPTQSCSGSGCVVTGLTNGTTYTITVHANNSAGSGPESSPVTVVPAGRPGAPTIGAVTRTTGGASVSYTAGAANGPTPTFTLTAVPAAGSTGAAAPSVACSASPCAITGLTNGVSYTFTVTATGTTGLSATSAASSPAITAASVPAAPASITETDGSGSATLTFSAPAANGDPITGYQYSTNAGSTFSTLSTTTSGSTVTATVTGLTNGSAASIVIRAVNGIGNSATSATVTANPAALPAAPTNPAAQRINGGARVTFAAPANPATAPVTGYTVTAIPSSGASTTTTCSASPCDVTGLTNGTSYRFTVVATNRIGSSTASGQTGAITAAQAPAAPAVTAAAKDGSVILTITAGAANGDAITGYTVTTSPAPSGGATTSCGTSGSCTVTGLTNGTAYIFSVVATNGIGSSTAATAAATPQAVPGTLSGGQTKPGDGKVTVSFTTPSSGTIPTTYEYSLDGTTWTTATNVVDANGRSTFDITGLANGTPAHVYLRGQSSYGPGPTLDLGSVTPVALPAQPTGVSASRVDGGAQISFTAPTSTPQAPVTGYTVTAYPADGSPSTSVTCSSGPCTINGLTVGTAYAFSVTATNANGGTESARTTPALTIAGHPGVPTGASAAAKDGSAVVTFTAPSDNGGDAITSYTVTASPGGASATCTASPCTVSGLTNGTAYTFAVTATNGLGTSAASTASTAVTPQPVPTVLTGGQAKPGDNKVTVTFPTPTSGTIPTSYEYSLDGTTWVTATNVVDTNGTSSFDITSGLTNGTPTHVYLRGQSSYGPGPSSADLGPVTPALPPGMPGAPTATRQANGDVRLSFNPPASDGGSAITGYEYTTDGGATWHTLTYTGSTTLTGTISGLTNGTTYQIATRAVTPAGHSDPSAIIAVVAASAPGAPTLGAVSPHDGSADVAFTPPTNTGGDPVTSYTVTATPQGGGTPVTVTCTASPCTVPGLANGTTYTFAVSATNGVGTSAGSTPSGPVTPQASPGQLTGASAVAGNHSVTVTFPTPSASDPTHPTSYQYSVDSGAWQAAGVITDNGDGTSSFTIDNLANDTTVHLDVRGVSSYGTGVRTNLGAVTPSAPPAPGVPGSPTAVRQSNGDVKLTFAAPSGTPPSGYEYNLGDGTGWHVFTPACTSSPCTVTGLTEGRTYAITVRADHGTGAPSDPSTAVSVTAAAAPDAPANVTATPRAESVELSFTAPAAHGSPILGYDYSTDGATWTPLTYAVSGSTVTGTVVGLTDGNPYAFRVRANNTVGSSAGTATTPASVTPKAGPAAPASGSVTVAAVPGGATVSFTPPTGNGTTSDPTGYEYSTDGGLTWHTLTTSGTPPSQLTGSITPLTNGTTYAITVRGTSSYGSGSATTPVSITPQGRPAAPSTPAVSLSGTTATVSWTPGNTGGAGVVTYTVSASPAGGTCTTTTTSCVIGGLAPGSTYTFTVTPTNSLGTGTTSPGVLVNLTSPTVPGTTPTPAPGAAAWYVDPVSAATRAKEAKVPGNPKRYHGKKKATVATYRAANGQFVVAAGTPAGRPLAAGQGVQFAMKSLFKGSSTKLTKKGKAQVQALAASLRSVSAISCEGYTDYALAHGKKLSSKRAKAVCKALVADGVRVAVSSRGYGGKRPVVLAKKAGARKANNRIVVIVARG